MGAWTFLGGTPRHGQSPAARGEPERSGASEAFADARVTLWLGGALLAWALGGALRALAAPWVGAAEAARFLAAMLVLGLLLALGVTFVRAPRVRAAFTDAAAFAFTLALAAAVGGHLLHARGAALRPLAPPEVFVLVGLPRWLAAALLVGVLLVVPLLVGARLRALSRALAVGGAHARSWTLAVRAIPEGRGAAGVALGASLRIVEGYRAPGLLALDLVLTFARRAAARLRGWRLDRVRADADLDVLRARFEELGATVEAADGALRVRRAGGASDVTLRPSRLALPPAEGVAVLDLTGGEEEVAALRRLLEADLAHALLLTWSASARRLEARVNAAASEARLVASVEERGLLLEELDRVAALLARRALSAEDALLLSWKVERERHRLALALLSGERGERRADIVVAPAAALPPDLEHVMAAGGLSAMARLVYAPVWVVPAGTVWGEVDLLVDARTGRPVDGQPALLETLGRRGPGPFVDVGREAAFLPAPAPTAALLGALRAAPGAPRVDPDALDGAIETLYLPRLRTDEAEVDGLTGVRHPLP